MLPVFLIQETTRNLKPWTIVNDNAKTHNLSKSRQVGYRRVVSEPILPVPRNQSVNSSAMGRNSAESTKGLPSTPMKGKMASLSRWGDSKAHKAQHSPQKADKAPVMTSRREENLVSMMATNVGDELPRLSAKQVLNSTFASDSDSEESSGSGNSLNEILSAL